MVAQFHSEYKVIKVMLQPQFGQRTFFRNQNRYLPDIVPGLVN